MLFRALLVLAALSSSAFVLPPAPAGTVATVLVTSTPVVRVIESPLMGRGDKRTTKGKRKAKSFGNARPRNSELRKRKAKADGSDE